MNKFITFLTVSVFLFASCEKPEKINPNKHSWGTKNLYADFLINHFHFSDTSNVFHKRLFLEFNQEAKASSTGTLELQLVEKITKFGADGLPKNSEFQPTREFSLFKNGEKCSDNILKINNEDKKADITIAFNQNTKFEDHSYTLCLKVINNGGLDRIDNTDVSAPNNIILTDEWVLEKKYVHNPLGLLFFWGIVGIIGILILCFVLSRVINPSTKFSKLYIDYHDGGGDHIVKMGSSYKLICTNNKKKYSIFYRFFIGNVKVEVNDFWTNPVTINSGRMDTVQLTGLGDLQLENDTTIRKEAIIITGNGQKVTIITA